MMQNRYIQFRRCARSTIIPSPSRLDSGSRAFFRCRNKHGTDLKASSIIAHDLNWTELNKSTQLYDAFIGHARQRHDYTSYWLAAVSARLVLNTRISIRVVHGLGWIMGRVGSRLFCFLVGSVGSTIAKVLKIWKDYVNAFKVQLDKIWLHQTVKFDFTADLTGTWIRSVGVIKW